MDIDVAAPTFVPMMPLFLTPCICYVQYSIQGCGEYGEDGEHACRDDKCCIRCIRNPFAG